MLFTRPLVSMALVLAGSAAAAADSVRLCTAQPTGMYALVGQDIREAGGKSQLAVSLVETEGSMDNLAKLASGTCDAAIVQADAYLLYQQSQADNRLEVRRPTYLYDEVVHLVCRDDVAAKSLAELVDGTEGLRIAVGTPGSGSGLTWGSFGTIDDTYSDVERLEIGGQGALDAVASERRAHCLFHVAAPGSSWLRDTVSGVEGLSLVPVTDRDLDGATIVGIEAYEGTRIDASTYPELAPDGARRIDTLAVRAVLVALDAWAAANESAYRSLVGAVEASRARIAERTGGG